MGALTHNVHYRIASFVRPAKMKTNCCCATVVTKAITHIVSNRKWSIYLRAIGKRIVLAIPGYGDLHTLLCNFFFCFILKRYCYECVNKATNDRKCIVCGGHRLPPVGKMIYCELCPRAYHHDCYIPPMIKVCAVEFYENCFFGLLRFRK